nr:(2Fe-2S)-binding protein [Actinomycetospora corticicola]
MAARLVAPVLAAATVHGALPVLTGVDLRWRGHDAPRGASWWLASPRLVSWRDPDELHGEIVGPLAGLAAALLDTVAVSERLLWGEVATAVAKATRVVATARPAAATPVRALAAALLDRPPLAGTRTPGGGRSTCCLAYRVPGGHTCADCPLGAGRAGADVLARRPRTGRAPAGPD